MSEETAVDFALAVYREDEQWQVNALPPRLADDLDGFVKALRQQPSEGVTLGMLSVAEDFFVIVRPLGSQVRLLLSDVTSAAQWPIARQVLDELGLPAPEGDDLEQVQPAGDLDIVADLGVSAMEMGALCDDLDLYPDEMLGDIADRLGFGDQLERALDASIR